MPRESATPQPNGESSRKATGQRSDGNRKKKPAYSQKDEAYSQDLNRALPASPEAERGVLGSILLAPHEVLDECIEKIDRDHFYNPAHALIYDALVELKEGNAPIDLITVTQAIKDKKLMDQIGGPAYLTEIATCVPSAANAGFYLKILKAKHTLRRLIAVCTDCTARSYEEQDDVAALLDQAEQEIFAISGQQFNAKVETMQVLAMRAMDTIEKIFENKGQLTGLPTGFAELDKLTNGLHGGEMVVVAARPGMGKTALAMNIAEHVATKGKKAVAVFSLEMNTQQLVQRLLCSCARVDLQNTRGGFLSADRDFPRLTHAASVLAESRIYIDDTPGLAILELRAKARRLKSQYDVDLIVIDYLQLLRSTTRRAQDNRQLEITEISSGIKALAKELDLPIIVLAQLNRQPEARSGGEPRLSDLRESGSIEQDADVVGLLVRKEFYADADEEREQFEGKAELIIAKQRNGPTGKIPLTFLKEYTRFEDRAPEFAEQEV